MKTVRKGGDTMKKQRRLKKWVANLLLDILVVLLIFIASAIESLIDNIFILIILTTIMLLDGVVIAKYTDLLKD